MARRKARQCVRATTLTCLGWLTCRPRKKQGFLSGVTQALDFSAARSKEDEELLYQAKNAKGGRLTDEQAA